jgi:Predicted membrane protein
MLIEIFLAVIERPPWTQMFDLDQAVGWPEKIIRPIVVYLALIVMLRIFGKRELAQLNPFDLVVILSLSNTVQNAIIGPDNSLIGGLVGAVALLAINYVVSRLNFSYQKIEILTEGSPAHIIEKGRVNERERKRELITPRDLEVIAHQHGFDSSADIEKLVLDPNGNFLVDGKEEIKDARFKREVLKKIGELSKQLTDLSDQLQKT